MINLAPTAAIAALYQDSTIPRTCLYFLNDHLNQIRTLYENDDLFPSPAHSFYLLESADQLTPDAEQDMAFSCTAGTYWPEYIESYTFDDGNSLYKIFVLLDNECTVTFFTLQGIHSLETECWLHEQATVHH